VGYAKTDLIVPHAPFADLATANAAARAWCTEINAGMHSEIAAVPAVRLAIEAPWLSRVPSLRLQLGKTVSRKVDRLSSVRFGSARYSVPMQLIGHHVQLRVSHGRLSVLGSAGQIVADHALIAPGEASVLDENYGGPQPAPRRAVRPKTVIEKDFCALGEVGAAFITGAAAAGVSKLPTELSDILTLRHSHGEAVLLAALERAVRFGRWRAADVRSILAAGTGIAHPVPAGEALVLQLPLVPTRPLSDYALSELVR
jgi:hypothetical protein